MARLTDCDCDGSCDACERRRLQRERVAEWRTHGAPPPGVTLETVPPPGDWIRHARCKTVPVNVFFPERGDHVAGAIARQVCAQCPVLAECRAYALDAGPYLSGIWGGLSHDQRRRTRRGKVA